MPRTSAPRWLPNAPFRQPSNNGKGGRGLVRNTEQDVLAPPAPRRRRFPVLEHCADILARGTETRRGAAWAWSAVKAENSSNALRAHDMQTSCPCAVGTWLGHGPPDDGGHERIAAASSTLGLTSANAQDQQCLRSLRFFHTATATIPLVQIAVRGDPAPMGETRATTSASISQLRRFTALAHYYPVGGVS
jgi:hypothetical protein